MHPRLLALHDPPFAATTGRGVRVAVVDSGVQRAHPHIGAIYGGVNLTPSGEESDDTDRIGHGTAVAAAILDLAPAVELLAVRVFDRKLQTTADTLARAIEWSAAQGARLINLSLGTANPAHAERLAQAVRAALSVGALVVAARDPRAPVLLPGTLAGVIGVMADRGCPRDHLTMAPLADGTRTLRASPFPRPIDGLPPERNVSGVSFAVANASGFLARWLEAHPDDADADGVLDALARARDPEGQAAPEA